MSRVHTDHAGNSRDSDVHEPSRRRGGVAQGCERATAIINYAIAKVLMKRT